MGSVSLLEVVLVEPASGELPHFVQLPVERPL